MDELVLAFGAATLIVGGFVGLLAGYFWGKRKFPSIWQIVLAVTIAFLAIVVIAFMTPAYMTARSSHRVPGPNGYPVDATEPGEVVVTGSRIEEPRAWRTSVRAPDGQALPQLQTGQAFDLRVRFASLSKYCDDEVEHPVGPRVTEILEEGLALDLLLIADPRYFAVLDADQARRIVISKELPNDPCDSDIADLDPLVAQSAADFHLSTLDRLGRGSAAVIVYRNGRPIDEIPLRICVGTCPRERPVQIDTRLGDTLGELLNDADSAPPTDASLYVFDFTNNASAGVLAERDAAGEFHYRTWPVVNSNVDSIRYQLVNTYGTVLSNTEQQEELAKKGEEIASLIFSGDAGEAARAHLEQFLLTPRAQGQPVPSLFVRIASVDDTTPLVFPVGLIAMRNVADGSGFLGRHARIVMPLATQNYEVYGECPARIMTVLPTATDANEALSAARVAMTETVAARWWAAAGEQYQWSSTKSFGEWLLKDPTIDSGAVLFILAHHYSDSLRVGGAETVESGLAEHLEFNEPSWVVLNGCGTVRYGGIGFINKFNEHGAQAVIATHSEVPARMAGAYYKCLDEKLSTAGEKYDLGTAHFEAAECLWNEKKPSADLMGDDKAIWGANALKYTLLGNPNLRVCRIAPKQEG